MTHIVCTVSACVILAYSIMAASRASYRTWTGPKWRFWALSFAFSAAAAGALGIALGVPFGDEILSAGAAAYLLGNRRTCFDRREGIHE